MPTTEPHADLEILADYEGTPILTLLVDVCSAIGLMIALYAVLLLPAGIRNGSAETYYVLLVLVVVVNIALRVARARRRRALGLTRAERRYRMGIGPREPHRRS
jgi:hypothetical protein